MKPLMIRLKKEYEGKNVLVVGLGLLGGGVGLAQFFSQLGARVTVTDKKNETQLASSIEQLKQFPITYHLGVDHDLGDFLNADVIFKGPFVPWNLTGIIEAQKKGVPIEMELSFAAKYCPAPIIGITGTRGKSTTTYMIYRLLKENGYRVHLGGSIPGISTVMQLSEISSGDWLVMELPSWPLAGFHRKQLSTHISVFTNYYPDHLNFYQKLEDYLFDKKASYLYQTDKDFLIAGSGMNQIIDKDNVKSHVDYVTADDFPYEFKYIKGDHNKENAAMALKVGSIIGIDKDKAIASLISFKGLPFRQEEIMRKKNIVFINDTTSTTPIATIKAIETFSPKKIVLILGGNSKNLPYGELLNSLEKVNDLVLLKGSFTDELMPYLIDRYKNKISGVFDDLHGATKKAVELAGKYSTEEVYVLFSPSATSFSMFNNEFHRGLEFNKIVKTMFNA